MENYMIKLRNSLKDENRYMPLLQCGSAIIIRNNKEQILLQSRRDRRLWGLPGGCQELGETFEDTIIREVKQETNLEIVKKDLKLISVISGKTRYNTYPNGDEVYNNTVLFLTDKYTGVLKCGSESKELKFFSIENLPQNLMDKDLIEKYIEINDIR